MKDDRGSVLLLSVGLIPILAMLIAVGTDISVLMAQRRALSAEVDSAVLAAAQSADLELLYTSGKLDSLPLDCAQAKRVVNDRIGSERSDTRAARARVRQFTCRNNTVHAVIETDVRLPFSSNFGVAPTVEVTSEATARSPFSE